MSAPLDPGTPGARRRLSPAAVVVVLAVAMGVAIGVRALTPGDPAPAAPAAVEPVVEPAASDVPTPAAVVEVPAPEVAAAAFVVGLNDPARLDPAARWAWLQEVATPAAAAELEAAYSTATTSPAAADLYAALGADPSWAGTTPIGYRLVSHTPGERAEVDVWATHVLTAGGIEPRVWWSTTRTFLEWDGTGWRVAAAELLPGPSPVADPPELFAPAAHSFTRYEVAS